MLRIVKRFSVLFLMIIFIGCSSGKKDKIANTKDEMPMFVIEREIPNAGKLSFEELKAISQTSCSVLKEMGSEIQWIHSYVTGDKIYCIYTAPNAEMVFEHAKQGGFPANVVSEVATIISPETAELE